MSDRSTCTKEAPMPKGHEGRWAHPDAKKTYDEHDRQYNTHYDHYHCPNCDLHFVVEIAQ